MTINVYLLLTLFGRAQSTAPGPKPLPTGEEPALWLTVQPYIRPDDLPTWITTATTNGALNYVLLEGSGVSHDDIAKMIPVPLPPKVSITVQRFANIGTAGETKIGNDLYNDRTGVKITDATTFQADNINPGKTNQITPKTLPYAEAYFDQLTDFYNSAGHDAVAMQQLAQMLLLNFEGGSVRRFRDTTVSDQDTVSLFRLEPRVLPPGLDPNVIQTVGLTSACGLMLRLDKDIGFNQLRQVNGIKLFLQQPADVRPGTNIALTGQEPDFLKAYFAAIDPSDPVPNPASMWRATLLPDSTTRVYVLPHRTALAPTAFRFGSGSTDQRTLFRRDLKSEASTTTPTALLMSEIESIGLFYRRSSATEIPPTSPATINVGFYELLRARLVAYRGSLPNESGVSLWQLVPTPNDRDRFVELFQAVARENPPATWPDSFTIHGSAGMRIEAASKFLETGYVGSYLFPWDDAGNVDPDTLAIRPTLLPTVLFWFAVPVTGTGVTAVKALDVTLVMKNATMAAAAYAPFDPTDGTTTTSGGPLWEWAGSPTLPAAPWSAVDLDATSLVSRIIPTFIRRGDYVLQPALSAQHTEGVLQVDYPGPPIAGTTVTTITPADDARREVAAYRKLNVYATDTPVNASTGAVQAFNPWSNLFAVWSNDIDDWHRHIFQYRFRSDLYAPLPGTNISPWAFFAGAYAPLGGTRQIILDLEHTSGHAMQVATTSFPMVHDAPPTLPSSLRSGKSASPLSPFMTVDFLPAASGQPERARVTMDPSYLDTSGSADQGAVTAAWRSIAELANAAAVRLRGQFRRFDFARAVAAARAANGPVSLFDGMVPVPPYEAATTAWDFPATDASGRPGLQATAKAWLAGGTPQPQANQFDVPLTVQGAPGIAATCHAIEFWLEIVRDSRTVPPREGRNFVRLPGRQPVSDVFGPAGENVIVIAQGDPIFPLVQSLYSGPGRFVDQISGTFVADPTIDNGWRAISPSDTAQMAAAPFRALIGSSPDQPPNPRSWIVPALAFEAGDNIVASLLPLAFRPLADRYAGTASYGSLCRYMYAIEMLIDASPGAWSSAFTTPEAWRGWFATLAGRSGNVVRLALSARQLVAPAYIVAPSPTAPDPNLDSEVAALIADLQAARGGTAGTDAAIRQKLLAKPSLFAEARALLLTRLRALTQLPPDLLRIQSERAVNPPDGFTGARRLERATLSLNDVLLKDAGTSALGFVEVLGNEKYDFQFLVDDFEVYGIEAFLASPLPDPDPSVAPHPLDGGVVHVPAAGAQAGNPPRVDLPSRQPLVSPVHLYTDVVTGMESRDWVGQFAGTGISATALLNGRAIQAAQSGEPSFVPRLVSADFDRSTFYDRAVVAAVFYVVSDEQNEFANDAFRFKPVVAPAPSGPPETTLVPPPAVSTLFKALEGNSVLNSIDGLNDALDDDTVDFVTKALVPPDPIVDDASYSTIAVTEAADGSESLSAPMGYSAFLFTPPATQRGSAPGPTRHLLIITTEVPVWNPAQFSLYQTRNQHAPISGAPTFSPLLWQFSPVVGDDAGVRVRLSRAADATPIGLGSAQRTITPVEAVQDLLAAKQYLQRDVADNTQWKSDDLSIVVSAVHEVCIPTLIAGGGAQQWTTVPHGKLPLCNALASKPALAGDPVTFDGSRRRFSVDFTWTSNKNDEVLAIRGVQVVF